MNYNISPKKRALMDTAFAKRHQELIESPNLEYSLEVALAEYVESLARDDQKDPAAKFERIAGAHSFLFTLRNLGSEPTKPAIEDLTNLGLNRKE